MKAYFDKDYKTAKTELIKVVQEYPINRPIGEKVEKMLILGECYQAMAMYDEAERMYLDALYLLEKARVPEGDIYKGIYGSLSSLYSLLHNYEKAKIYAEKCKSYFEKNHDYRDAYARCLANCAVIEKNLGNNMLAKFYTDMSIKYMRDCYDYSCFIENNYGSVPDEFIAAVYATKVDFVVLLSNSAITYDAIGEQEASSLCMNEAIDISKQMNDCNLWHPFYSQGFIYLKKGRYDDSITNFETALSMVCGSKERDEMVISLIVAKYLKDKSKNDDLNIMIDSVSASISKNIDYYFEFLSTEERINLWHHYEKYFPLLNLIIYKTNGNFNTLYNNVLYSKQLLLKSACKIRDIIISSNNEETKELYDELLGKKQHLFYTKEEDKQVILRKEIDEIEKQLNKELTKYKNKDKTIGYDSVRRMLQDDEVAIEFFHIYNMESEDFLTNGNTKVFLYALILKHDYKEPHIIYVCDDCQVADDTISIDSLYNLLWVPLSHELDGIKTIYFSPDGVLNTLAIEYALCPDRERMNDKYNMVRLSSTRELVERKGTENPKSAVLYGGLKYDLEKEELITESRKVGTKPLMASRAVENEALRYGVSYLKGTEEEIENIERDLKKKGVECVTVSGNAGTEESFRALSGKSVDILHLATHGYFWSEEDAERRNYIPFLNGTGNSEMRAEDKAMLRSGLFFSGANVSLRGEELPDDVEDGVLTAMELSSLNLGKVDLVVLSACQSGLGETSGDGVFGLQRGFKLAGAKSLLMSLWKVDDKATQILMTEFYKNLLAGDTKVESLKKAQKVLQADETYKDPEYWAGWILLDALN